MRCAICGTHVSLGAGAEESPHSVPLSEPQRATPILSLSRLEPASVAGGQTLLLLEDGRMELRAIEGDVILVTGHASRATVSAWRSLVASRALEAFTGATGDASEGRRYDLELAGSKHSWTGTPTAPSATRIWSMLTGLWGMVAETPL
ncbi:MAG: hypothetical protein IPJ34_35130 [Myxococcales bacterium]|nr:hypothetical protein [Myxococcales bacterium]